jgi:GT2 family glycosyltransferase
MKQTYKNFEIIVVDNASTDDTPMLIKAYRVRVVRDETKRLSYLFNLGWRNARGKIVVYIADDAEASPTWLENIIKSFEIFKDAGAVGGLGKDVVDPEMIRLYRQSGGSKILSFLASVYRVVVTENKLFHRGLFFESGAFSIGVGSTLTEPISVDVLSTTNVGIKRDILERMKGFDENFYFNHADGDLFLRIKKHGYKLIFNPAARVVHHLRFGPSRDPFFIARDTAYFYMKHVRPRRLSSFLRFLVNVTFLNSYWFYKAFKTKQLRYLKGIPAFVRGVIDYFKRPRESRTCAY